MAAVVGLAGGRPDEAGVAAYAKGRRAAARSTLWRATYELLERGVAVRTLDPRWQRTKTVIAAGCRASRLTDSRFAQVFDAGGSTEPTWIVTERPTGACLAELVKAGPLDPAYAAWMVGEAAGALAGAHAQGLAHLCLSLRSLIQSHRR